MECLIQVLRAGTTGGTATTYSLSAAPSSVTVGSPVTVAATLAPGSTLTSTLVITLIDSLSSTVAGTISIPTSSTTGSTTVTPLVAGTHNITASHSGGGFSGGDGSTSFSASDSGPLDPFPQPNPAETVWTLYDGDVAVSPEILQGTDRVWLTSLYDDGRRISYDPSAVLAASVSMGGLGAAIFAPSAAWTSASEGSLTLTIRASDTATLTPGVYDLIVTVSFNGATYEAYNGHLRVLANVGNATLPTPYNSLQDMRDRYDQIETLQNRMGDATGFLNVRSDVRKNFDRRMVTRYNPRPGFVKERRATFDPVCGYDVPSGSRTPPTKEDVTLALAAGGLVREEKVIDMTSYWSLAYVLERQEVGSRNTYREEAAKFRAMAEDIWHCFQAQIDIDDDAVPDWLIDMDAIYLPSGAAP